MIIVPLSHLPGHHTSHNTRLIPVRQGGGGTCTPPSFPPPPLGENLPCVRIAKPLRKWGESEREGGGRGDGRAHARAWRVPSRASCPGALSISEVDPLSKSRPRREIGGAAEGEGARLHKWLDTATTGWCDADRLVWSYQADIAVSWS